MTYVIGGSPTKEMKIKLLMGIWRRVRTPHTGTYVIAAPKASAIILELIKGRIIYMRSNLSLYYFDEEFNPIVI